MIRPSASICSKRSHNGQRWLMAALLTSTALVAQPVFGNAAFAADNLPTGGQVVSGGVAIATSGTSTTITQSSDKAIVNWNGFSVGQGNSVNFVQPGTGSAILNRVTGNTSSTIAGTLSANGQVYLINPNGIAITPTGTVRVGGGFVASTLDISNDDFLKGQYNFNGNGASAGVSNEGVITVGRGGYAALLGGTVKNDGLIAVPMGKVGLGSGEQATLDLSGDGFLQVAVPTKDGAEGNGALIENGGTISAEGGTVVMKAAAARNAARNSINLSGVVEANSVSGSDGAITLGGGDGGKVAISGKVKASSATGKGGKITVTGRSVALKGATVDASGAKGGGTVKITAATDDSDGSAIIDVGSVVDARATGTGVGGTVIITGNVVAAEGGSVIDASGAAGGTVLLGGDYQGGSNASHKFVSELVSTANKAYVADGATIRVDGTAGAGGRAVVWSDDTTVFLGTITATGAGNAAGGVVETSGHNLLLGDKITVSTLSEQGETGTWLIDPYNVTISSSGSSNVSVTVSGNPWNVVPLASGANINNSTLSTYLGSTNVAITTNGGGAEAGNITVNGAVSWSAATTLSLLADASTGGVFINANISGSNASSGLVLSAGSGGISQAGGTAIQAGTLTATTANGGSVTLTNTGNLVSALGASSVAGSFALTSGQALTVSGNLTSNGTLSLATTSGALTINGALTDSHANSSLTLSAAGDLILSKDVTQSGTNAAVSLTYGGSYSLSNGARVSLPDGGASLSLNGTSYTLIHDVTALQNMSGSGSYALGNDIDASATSNWNSGAGFEAISGFSGTLAGFGHFVDSLTINRPTQSTQGLFGMLFGTARDLTLSNVSINGNGTVGGVAGRLSGGTLSNVHVTGTVTGQNAQVGGLVGWSDIAVIGLSSSAASVAGTDEVGGLVGRNRAGSIATSYATGAVTGTGIGIGGLVGTTVQGSTLTDTYASGLVTGASGTGGVVGSGDGTTITSTNVYWDMDSTGQSTSVVGNGFSSGSARAQSTYSGFDFSNVWVMIAGETRPMLRNEYSTVIATPAALQLMSQDLTGSYKLGANIDMTSALAIGSNGYYGGLWGASGFVPIGSSSSKFTGSFNGQSYTITGLTINRSGTNYVGLFGYTNGATISNVTLSGGSITGNDDVGALIGYMHGGSVSSASAGATVTGASTSETNAGGLVGANDGGAISRASASGNVTGAGYQIGGLVGYLVNGGSITQSYATGNVTGTNTGAGMGYIGGLVGASGFTGNDGGTISQSYATGTVTGSSGPIGGFIGHNEGTITDAYATGRVIGLSGASNIGGFVGVNFTDGTISNAYSTGYVSGGTQLGGFAGYNNAGASAITSAYWDTQTSGQSVGIFGGPGSVTGLTTAAMKTLATFTGAGWSIDDAGGTSSVWRIYDGDTMPLLRSFMTSLTVTGGSGTKTYDGSATSSDVGTLVYSPSGYTTSLVQGTASYTASSANAGTYTGTGLKLSGLYSSQLGYDITFVSGSLLISKAALTVTASNDSKTYDGLGYSGGNGMTYSGFVGNDSAASLGGTLSYGGTSQGAVNAGTYSITASGLTSGNYTISYQPGTLTVAQRSITVAASNDSKTYDGLGYSGGNGVTYSGFVGNDSAASLGGTLSYGGTAQGAVNAGTYSITASGLTSGNYTISYQPGTLTVARRSITVAASNDSKTYDGLGYGGGNGVTYSGFVGNDSAASLGGTLSYGGTAQGAVNAGTYSITASGLTSGNYTISYQPGTLAVAQRSITVAANAQSMTYGDPVPELTYTVGGSGLVTGDSLFGALATSATSASNVGAYGIVQGSLRNSNYRITYTAGTLIVSPLSTVAPRPRPLSVNTTSHEVLEPILIPSQLTPQAVVYDNPAVNPSSGKFIMTAETCSGAQMGQAQSSSGLAITCTGN